MVGRQESVEFVAASEVASSSEEASSSELASSPETSFSTLCKDDARDSGAAVEAD
jgi:hypothetical protein